ncbi:MAG: hypothetical protein ACE5E6_07355 [Phycisphaerae bacterium]
MSMWQLVKRCALCAVVYVAGAVAWRWVGTTYAVMFRSAGDAVFGGVTFGDAGTVRFERHESADREMDTALVLRAGSDRGDLPVSSRFLGYVPTVLFVALAIATPLPWSRRGWMLVAGLAFTQAFVAARVALKICDTFGAETPLRQYAFGPFWNNTIGYLASVMTDSLSTTYLVPATIWIIVAGVAMQRSDWARLTEAARGVRASAP